MLNKLIKWLQGFQKEEELNLQYIASEKTDFDLNIPVNRVIKTYDPTKKSIIIIDDSRGIVSVIEDFLKEAEEKDNFNLSDYNIITFYDKYAPFVLKETLERLGNLKIDYAIIDIVLPGKIRTNNIYAKMDGIDVAILLNKEYGCDNFCFFTGNVVSEHVGYIKDKVIKFNKHFNIDIQKFIIFKGDNDGQETVNKFSNLLKKTAYNLN